MTPKDPQAIGDIVEEEFESALGIGIRRSPREDHRIAFGSSVRCAEKGFAFERFAGCRIEKSPTDDFGRAKLEGVFGDVGGEAVDFSQTNVSRIGDEGPVTGKVVKKMLKPRDPPRISHCGEMVLARPVMRRFFGASVVDFKFVAVIESDTEIGDRVAVGVEDKSLNFATWQEIAFDLMERMFCGYGEVEECDGSRAGASVLHDQAIDSSQREWRAGKFPVFSEARLGKRNRVCDFGRANEREDRE